MMPDMTLVVAYDRNRAIGFVEDMPWKRSLPADLKRFKDLTMGNTILMGRKTHESIGRALPGRNNIVLSRDTSLDIPSVYIINSLEELDHLQIQGRLFVIGGAQVYRLALPFASTVLATEVDAEFEADTFLDELDSSWREVSREHHKADEKNAYNFDFVEYKRT